MVIRRFPSSSPSIIERLFIAVADTDDGEAIYTTMGEEGFPLPIVAINDESLAQLMEFAQGEANYLGVPVRIISFTGRTLHDTVRPVSTGD